tara:strand:+ start:572 stop:793 length:222 start_codon:yes stop_codon:yes gene_type:complete
MHAVEQQLYLLDANLLVLKLYKLNPEKNNNDLVALILIKALMQLPSNDFRLCCYLVPEPVVCYSTLSVDFLSC